MTLRLVHEGRIARLIIARPEKRNAFTNAMWEALPPLVAEATATARVLVVEGEGSTFCAGADIAEFAALTSDPAWREGNQGNIRAAMSALADAAIPTIALVEGDCIGGGCGLALCCDLRIAGPAARFGITPAKLGLVYSLEDTRRLVEAVGASQARRILFSADLLDAAESARIGLATILTGHPRTEAEALAHRLAAVSGHSQRESKRMIGRILAGQTADDADTRALFAAAFDGPDFREGSAAFLDRRPARFE
jgi:enoyl-CoA hydratase/carnithine racemase